MKTTDCIDWKQVVTFVTRNSQYVIYAGTCVQVADRRTGKLIEGHAAVGLKLGSALRRLKHGQMTVVTLPNIGIGDILALEGERSLLTSAVVEIHPPQASAA